MASRRPFSGLYRTVMAIVLGVSVIGLTAAIPALYVATVTAMQSARVAIADACAAELRAISPGDRHAQAMAVDKLQRRYDIAVAVVPLSAAKADEPLRFYRPLGGDRMLEVRFFRDSAHAPLGALRTLVIVAIVASFASVMLFAVNLSALIRPREAAGGERGSPEDMPLFQPLESTIRSLRRRAHDLERMQEEEKQRADELASVTATLVRNLASGFISVDANDRIVDINAASRELLGLDVEPVTNRSIEEALGNSEFARTLGGAIRSRAALQRQEIVESGEDGRVFGLTTVPLFDERSRYLGMLFLFTDLTATRRLEQRVREMQSLADLGELSAGIAHEFRNSLATITGYLQLARKLPLPEPAGQRVAAAEAEAVSLASAVHSLLHLVRPVSPEVSAVDLRALAEEVAGGMPELGELELVFQGGAAFAAADPSLLRRVIENALRNSAESIAEAGAAGRIEITASTGAMTRLAIADNGVGVDPEQASKLFLPFQSTKAGGMGVGLALARKIVLSHGGRIRLEPRAEGGAILTIDLPPARGGPA